MQEQCIIAYTREIWGTQKKKTASSMEDESQTNAKLDAATQGFQFQPRRRSQQ